MRLIQMKVSGFRCYKAETTIDFGKLSVFIGKNDAGKSAILDTLAVFFDDKTPPDGDDRCVHSDNNQVRITCVFSEVPESLVIDAAYSTTLKDEYLLNGSDQLEITKVYECPSPGKPKLKGIFARAHHPTTTSYEDLLVLTNSKLKGRARELGVDLASVDQRVDTQLRSAIWKHAPSLGLKEIDIELKSETTGKIWEKLKASLPVYALFKSDRPSTDQDEEAQDPMKYAIKEAIKAQQAELEKVTKAVETQVQEIANRTVEKIREFDKDLASQLNPRVANKSWDTLFTVSLTGDNQIPINKRGSGTRRLVLLSFFRAQAERDAQSHNTGVIYAVEEPETSQHPNNQKLLLGAFEELSERPDSQVILTTHTPVLAKRVNKASLWFVGREGGDVVIRSGEDDTIIPEMVRSLGVLPDHGVRAFFGVEGRHDIKFLQTISRVLASAGEAVPDLGKAEENGHLVFVPLGGSSLDLWVSRLKKLGRPEFYLMDRDTIPPLEPRYKTCADMLKAQVNTTVWTTDKMELENYIHPSVIVEDYPNYAGTGADFENVPNLFAQAVYESNPQDRTWAEVEADKELLKKKESNAKRHLNTTYVGKLTPELLTEIDKKGEVRAWLKSILDVLKTE
ncbi:MAG: ATP-binding protein [Planctomycetota bacterium]|nr:ATP-binding protein [Planctomycetota bacterium]